MLFKKFAGVDVFDIEIDERDPRKLVDIIASLEATFGGINLEDIKAPECFEIEEALRARLKMPVFHDDQHGTAIIVGAAVLNGLELAGKSIANAKICTSGAGAAAIACLNILVALGAKLENIWVADKGGLVTHKRVDVMDCWRAKFARTTDSTSLADVMDGADVFLGLSGPGVLKPKMLNAMGNTPLVLALANPTPEIMPEEAKSVRPDAIICTGRSDYPNQVNNVLCFPYIFRGALDVGATTSASSSWVRTVERRSLGPIGASETVSLLRHFATVFGFRPNVRLSSAIEACDRCIAARIACVVVALPWSIWPIVHPSHGGTTIHHHTSGLHI